MVHAANDIRLEVETERACQEDEQLFCSDINVGQGRIHDCLRQYFDSLSEACKQEEFNERAGKGGGLGRGTILSTLR